MGSPCLSRPKEPSLSSPAGALLVVDSWHSPHNPALPSLVSPTSDVGRGDSVCCPGSAAKFRGDHESAQTRPCNNFDNRNDWVLSQHLWAQSQRTAKHHSPPRLFSSSTSSWNITVAGVQPCRSRRPLCHWYRPTEEEHEMSSTLLAPTDSKDYLIL